MIKEHTFTYWVAKHFEKDATLSIRGSSKQDAEWQLRKGGFILKKLLVDSPDERLIYCKGKIPLYELPKKVDLVYTDRLDLVKRLLGPENPE